MSKYWEQLRDPRWQKKRLEIMQRDEFTCQDCGDTGKTLNVHHGYYAKGMAPWEYEDATLHTLCEDCHKLAQQSLTALYRTIGTFDISMTEMVRGFASFFSGPAINDSAWLGVGIARAAGLDADDVSNATESVHGVVDVNALRREAHRREVILRGIKQVLEQMDNPPQDEVRAVRIARNAPRTLEIFARRLVGAPDPSWMADYVADVGEHRGEGGTE